MCIVQWVSGDFAVSRGTDGFWNIIRRVFMYSQYLNRSEVKLHILGIFDSIKWLWGYSLWTLHCSYKVNGGGSFMRLISCSRKVAPLKLMVSFQILTTEEVISQRMNDYWLHNNCWQCFDMVALTSDIFKSIENNIMYQRTWNIRLAKLQWRSKILSLTSWFMLFVQENTGKMPAAHHYGNPNLLELHKKVQLHKKRIMMLHNG